MADPRYVAHARRAEILKSASPEPLASYWTGYRQGMVRGDREAPDDDDAARDRHTAAAIAGDDEGSGINTFARWCGYYDGQRWTDVTAHRGLLRLAIAVRGESNRAFARETLGIDDGSLRQMLEGTRPVPATRHAELLDLASG